MRWAGPDGPPAVGGRGSDPGEVWDNPKAARQNLGELIRFGFNREITGRRKGILLWGLLEIWLFNFRICSLNRDRRLSGASASEERAAGIIPLGDGARQPTEPGSRRFAVFPGKVT